MKNVDKGHISIPLANGKGVIIIGGTNNAGTDQFRDYHVLHCHDDIVSTTAFSWSTPMHYPGLPNRAYMSCAQYDSDYFIFGGSSWDDHRAVVSTDFHK
jgi:hypothetical protein